MHVWVMCSCFDTQVGFMLLDELARQQGISLDKCQHSAAVGRGTLAGKRVLLAKPLTFMNASGEAVGKLARYYKARCPHNPARCAGRFIVHPAFLGFLAAQLTQGKQSRDLALSWTWTEPGSRSIYGF